MTIHLPKPSYYAYVVGAHYTGRILGPYPTAAVAMQAALGDINVESGDRVLVIERSCMTPTELALAASPESGIFTYMGEQAEYAASRRRS